MSSELDQAEDEGARAGAESLEGASWPPSKEALTAAAKAAAAAAATSLCASYGLGPASAACGMIAGAAVGWLSDQVLGFLWSVVKDPSFSPVLAETANVMNDIYAFEAVADKARDFATNTLEALYTESFGELSGIGPGGWAQELASLGVGFTPNPSGPWDPWILPGGDEPVTKFIDPKTGVTPFAKRYRDEFRARLPDWLEELQRATVLEALHVLGLAAAERAKKAKELLEKTPLKKGPTVYRPTAPIQRTPMQVHPGAPEGDLRKLLLDALE